MSSVTLLAVLAALQGIPGNPDPFQPDSVLSPPGGPVILLYDNDASEVAAIRLSVSLVEGSAEAGYGRVLLVLALERMEPLARRVGAVVSGARTPSGIAYEVRGPKQDFDYLGWLVRQALAAPEVESWQLEPALTAARAEVERESETPAGHVRAALRAQLAAHLPPDAGTTLSLDRLGPGAIREFWSRTHQVEAMTAVVVGAPGPEAALAVLQPLSSGEPASEPLDVASTDSPALNGLQAVRTWYGEAFAASVPDDPRLSVTALLAAEAVASRDGDYELGVELWEWGRTPALVLTGAAGPGGSRRMRQRVAGLMIEVHQGLTTDSVERAVATVRRTFLLQSRTPWGLARVVGQHVEATGRPEGAGAFLEALDGIDLPGVRAYVQDLAQRQRFFAEVIP